MASWMRAATAGMLGRLASLRSSLPQASEISVAIGTDLAAGAELTGRSPGLGCVPLYRLHYAKVEGRNVPRSAPVAKELR